ncbi:MAG: hypothetical protein AUK53_05170 [Betaproteobacteria bacterium CG2_30_59_46]|nr:MAG: hypothetical protein AUK53_05170 [Betaproteobacteria bacterium CG2_30_59_46]
MGHTDFLYGSDRNEPVHVHVERDDMIAKFWISPVRLGSSGGFGRVELVKIQKIVVEHQPHLLEAWHECFGSR